MWFLRIEPRSSRRETSALTAEPSLQCPNLLLIVETCERKTFYTTDPATCSKSRMGSASQGGGGLSVVTGEGAFVSSPCLVSLGHPKQQWLLTRPSLPQHLRTFGNV